MKRTRSQAPAMLIAIAILTFGQALILGPLSPVGADGHDDGTPVATQSELDALRADVDAGGAERVRLSARIDALEAGHTEAARIIGDQAARIANLEHALRQPRSAIALVKDIWYRLAFCETGGKMDNPNTGNGYYGYFQFSLATWRSVGGPGYPHHHPYAVQKHYAEILQARSGWGQWPACARKLGLI